MDPLAMDPSRIPVGDYEEDLNEAFTGPTGIAQFFNEEYEGAESFNGDYEDEAYYDGDGYRQPDPLETSASQRVAQDEVTQAETVSGHTQLGAAPGTTMPENVVPGQRDSTRIEVSRTVQHCCNRLSARREPPRGELSVKRV